MSASETYVRNPYTNPPTDSLTPAQKRDYVQACIVKQCRVSPEVAAQRVAELKPAQVEAVREAGRCGRVAEVQELLLQAFAEPADKKKGGKKGEPQDAD